MYHEKKTNYDAWKLVVHVYVVEKLIASDRNKPHIKWTDIYEYQIREHFKHTLIWILLYVRCKYYAIFWGWVQGAKCILADQ